jgi:hypothetical protein
MILVVPLAAQANFLIEKPAAAREDWVKLPPIEYEPASGFEGSTQEYRFKKLFIKNDEMIALYTIKGINKLLDNNKIIIVKELMEKLIENQAKAIEDLEKKHQQEISDLKKEINDLRKLINPS